MGQPEGRKSQQDDPDHRAQPLPERCGLLDDHHPGQHRHRQQAAYANPKHDQHQCPAAPQAERTVAEAQVPGCCYPLAIVVHAEAERAAALLETAPLERAELEHTCDREGGRANDPGMGVQPEAVMHEPVDLGISHKSHERERRPDDGIASQDAAGTACGRLCCLPACTIIETIGMLDGSIIPTVMTWKPARNTTSATSTGRWLSSSR